VNTSAYVGILIYGIITALFPLASTLRAFSQLPSDEVDEQRPSKLPDLASVIQLAEPGDAAAQFRLGQAYTHGQGVMKNDVEALRWWTKASEHGLAEAQSELGYSYVHGRGTVQDCAQGKHLYRAAAGQGLASAQYKSAFTTVRPLVMRIAPVRV